MRCMKVLKMLMVRRVSQGCEERRRLQRVIDGHLAQCDECREFIEAVRSDRIESGFRAVRSSMPLSETVKTSRREELGDHHRGGVGMARKQSIGTETKGKFFTLFIDGQEYHVDRPELTGAEIMDLGNIPRELGLILIEEDGTQVQVKENDVVELKPGRRFKTAPRFIRG